MTDDATKMKQEELAKLIELAEAAKKWTHQCDDPDCSCRLAGQEFRGYATPERILELIESNKKVRRALEVIINYWDDVVPPVHMNDMHSYARKALGRI